MDVELIRAHRPRLRHVPQEIAQMRQAAPALQALRRPWPRVRGVRAEYSDVRHEERGAEEDACVCEREGEGKEGGGDGRQEERDGGEFGECVDAAE